jgi:hypothetical protein
MKTYGKVEVQFHAFLISSLDEGRWPLQVSAALPPGENPRTYWTGGGEGFRDGLNAAKKRKIYSLSLP